MSFSRLADHWKREITIVVVFVFFIRSLCLDDDLFSLERTLTEENRVLPPSKSRHRTNSARDANQPVSSFESLAISTDSKNKKPSREPSPNIRTRRFSGDIVLPPSPSATAPGPEPSLFSPGSVRARTISSIHENSALSSLAKRQSTSSNSSPVESPLPHPPPSPVKRLEIRLSSGKTALTSDFIHTEEQPEGDRVNPPKPEPEKDPHPVTAGETTRHKLLQSVYVNNANANNSSPLAESLTNGTNSYVSSSESPSNCNLSWKRESNGNLLWIREQHFNTILETHARCSTRWEASHLWLHGRVRVLCAIKLSSSVFYFHFIFISRRWSRFDAWLVHFFLDHLSFSFVASLHAYTSGLVYWTSEICVCVCRGFYFLQQTISVQKYSTNRVSFSFLVLVFYPSIYLLALISLFN